MQQSNMRCLLQASDPVDERSYTYNVPTTKRKAELFLQYLLILLLQICHLKRGIAT